MVVKQKQHISVNCMIDVKASVKMWTGNWKSTVPVCILFCFAHSPSPAEQSVLGCQMGPMCTSGEGAPHRARESI